MMWSEDKNNILEYAKAVLKTEAEAIYSLIDRIDKSFEDAVNLMYHCHGKVIVTGMGKSGIICKKMAATFASSATPAFFLHPAEGVHGDLGIILKDDLVIAVSNSGETEEILKLIPVIKIKGIKIIAITGNVNSSLAQAADVVLDVKVKEEACPLGLIPTASTTAALVMGDALAVALLNKKGFTPEDFALIHPGGALGKKLLIRVEDLMEFKEELPLVRENTPFKDVLIEMTSKRKGITAVCDEEGNLRGVITDGDLRRSLEKHRDIFHKKAKDIMTTNPKRIEKYEMAVKALNEMEKYSITSLFVFHRPEDKKPIGLIHMHDILKAGIV